VQYYVVMPTGERFGPATLDQLNQWIQEGRVLMTTTLQLVATGQVMLARDVQGLVWTPQPMADPYSASPYGQSPYSSSPYGTPGPSAYTNTPTPGLYGSYPRHMPTPSTAGDSAAKTSLLISVCSFFCCPLVSPLALYYAYQARAQGARLASAAVGVAWVVNIIFALSILSFLVSLLRMR